jgi:hypothetical protein
MTNEVIAMDPFGKTIYLLPEIFFIETEAQEIYDDATTVIKKPAIIIEVKENNETQFYYFRSVGWNNTLLIKTRLNNGRWEAYDCTKNPTSEILLSVLKKGKQIF